MQSAKPSVFLSYRRNSSIDLACRLHDFLSEAGINVFLDIIDINAERFAEVIENKIINSDFFLVILTPDTLDSEWVQKEIEIALLYHKQIIPLTTNSFSFDSIPEKINGLGAYGGIPYDPYYAEAVFEHIIKKLHNPKKRSSRQIGVLVLVLALVALGIGLRIYGFQSPVSENREPTDINHTSTISYLSLPRITSGNAGLLQPIQTVNFRGFDSFSQVAWSPDSSLLAVIAVNGIEVYQDLNYDQPFLTIGSNSKLRSLDFHPNGSLLAYGGTDEIIRLWNVTTNTLDVMISDTGGGISQLDFSPDGNILLSANYGVPSDTLHLWKIDTGDLLGKLELPNNYQTIWDAQISPDGKYIVALVSRYPGIIYSDPDSAVIQVWETSSQHHLGTIKGINLAPMQFKFDSNDNLLLIHPSGEIYLSDLRQPFTQSLLEVVPHSFIIALNSEETLIAYTTGDIDSVRLYFFDAVENKSRPMLEELNDEIRHLVFSPDGNKLVLSTLNGLVQVWDVEQTALTADLTPPYVIQGDPTLSEDGTLMGFVSDNDELIVWDLVNNQERLRLENTGIDVVFAGMTGNKTFSASNTFLAYSQPGGFAVWNLDTGLPVASIADDSRNLRIVSVSPDDQLVAISGILSNRGIVSEVTAWDWFREAPLRTVNFSSWILDMEFSADSNMVAMATGETVQLWNVNLGSSELIWEESNFFRTVEFNQNGQLLAATGGDEGQINFWDMASNTELPPLLVDGTGHSLDFSPDSSLIAVGLQKGSVNVVEIWDTNRSVLVASLEGHTDIITSLEFSSTGNFVVSGDNAGTIRIWGIT